MNQSEFQLCDSLQLSAIRSLIRLTHAWNLNDDPILPHRLNDGLCHADRIDALPDYFYSLIQCPLACTTRQLQEELRSTSEIQSGLNLNFPRACFILCKEGGQTQRREGEGQKNAQPHTLPSLRGQEVPDKENKENQT